MPSSPRSCATAGWCPSRRSRASGGSCSSTWSASSTSASATPSARSTRCWRCGTPTPPRCAATWSTRACSPGTPASTGAAAAGSTSEEGPRPAHPSQAQGGTRDGAAGNSLARAATGAETRPVPDADGFRALARSSPWRWTTLRCTVRWPGHPWRTEPVRAWLRRPDRLRVETLDGRPLQVVHERGTQVALFGPGEAHTVTYPWPADGPAPVRRPDGLVAVRPDGLSYDAPMYQSYDWVAMLDPVELADGRDPETGADAELPGLDVDAVTSVEHGGRPAWEAYVRTTPAYEPRCGCCPCCAPRSSTSVSTGRPAGRTPRCSGYGSTSRPGSACSPTTRRRWGRGTTCGSRRSTSRCATTSSPGCGTDGRRPRTHGRRRTTSSAGAGGRSGGGASRAGRCRRGRPTSPGCARPPTRRRSGRPPARGRPRR